MVRFLHTSDWQMGITRRFLGADAGSRFRQARLDAVRRLCRLADERGCECIVVCGDLFESSQVAPATIRQTLEAMSASRVPIYILPGNHDPLDTASAYDKSEFRNGKPDCVTVIRNNSPITVSPGFEIVGVPWTSKRPGFDAVAATLAALEPAYGVVRVLLAHGAMDYLTPEEQGHSIIALKMLEDAIDKKLIHFAALGDRHSTTDCGSTGRIWYSGTPEVTAHREGEPGNVLVVNVTDTDCNCEPVRVGEWAFHDWAATSMNNAEDLKVFVDRLKAVTDKSRTVLRLELAGTHDLETGSALKQVLEHYGSLFASLDADETGLVLEPGEQELASLQLKGYAKETLSQLQQKISDGGPEAQTARDAVALLYRLAGGGR
jgi:DNA repair exonuclease SbcCD nuclease subunit